MSKIIQDVGALCRAGLEPLGADGFESARQAGALLMGVTAEGTDIAMECGWNGTSAMFVLGPRATARLAAAFGEAEDARAATWLWQDPKAGVARAFVITLEATLFVSYAGGEWRINHQSPVDWEPGFFSASDSPS